MFGLVLLRAIAPAIALAYIRSGNGPAFVAGDVRNEWEQRKIDTHYINSFCRLENS